MEGSCRQTGGEEGGGRALRWGFWQGWVEGRGIWGKRMGSGQPVDAVQASRRHPRGTGVGCPLRCHGNGTRWGMSVGELINQGQKTASTSKTKPGETNEETKWKKRKIQNTNQTKNPSEQDTRKQEKKQNKTWNGCGAENRGLKGGGLWLPLGDAPPPLAEHRVWPSYPAPRASAATEVTSLEKQPSGQTNPAPLESPL